MHTNKVTRMCDINFDPSLFINFLTDTELDSVLSSQRGLPRGVNYMIIGDPGVGKTTIILDMLANLQKTNPKLKILFISAEMNEIDLAIYVQRYPKFQYLNILFVESDCSIDTHNWETVSSVLTQGWDIVAIDSFYELQSVIKEEENIKLKEAESRILTLCHLLFIIATWSLYCFFNDLLTSPANSALPEQKIQPLLPFNK